MEKPAKIAPAREKPGILIPGMCAVSTTFMAEVELIRSGKACPIGSLTQMGTIRRGKRTEGRSPLIKKLVSLADPRDRVFGGWEDYDHKN
jgi:myo-inositol-1-phosphate synthase